MSTKTTFKRVALVAVASMSFGLLSSVTPANAISTGLSASFGYGAVTSLTVVGADSASVGALVRLDVTQNDTSIAGLGTSETITATVSGVPATKTLATNGGSVVDTSTAVGGAGAAQRSDFVVLESRAQATGTRSTTAALSTSSPTDWTLLAASSGNNNLDTATAGMGASAVAARAADGKIGQENAGFVNMDATHELTSAEYVTSYYVTIRPRLNSDVMNKGAYTFQFQLTDANGVVRSTQTVTIDFVSTNALSGAIVTATTNGTFLANTAVTTYDTSTNAYVKVTVKNRDGGLVRTGTGGSPSPSVTIQTATTLAPTYVDSSAVPTLADTGVYGNDFGGNSLTSPGNGTNRASDGVFGVKFTTGSASGATSPAYRVWAAFGNSTIVTTAFTVYAASGSGTASAAYTDALVTASGMSTADKLLKSNAVSQTWTLPTTTTTATVKFYIQTSSNVATPAAIMTATPTWSGTYGTATVTPATSTTGTAYTTDSEGNFTITVTNSAPVSGASLAIVLTGGDAFGAATYTATLTWAAAVATTISVSDPISGVYVQTGSTNVTTVLVKDQFGVAVSGQSVSVALGSTSANYSATTVIAPITTGASGTATYSLVGGATTATLDTLTFACVPTACSSSPTMTYNYVTTIPAVATLTGYHGYTQATAGTTLTPATGIYQSGTATALQTNDARDQSKSLLSFSDSATDDMINLRFYGLTSAGVAATGAVVTITAGAGGHILNSSGLPVKTRNYLVLSTGYTDGIRVMATGTGAISFTATSGTVSTTTSMWVENATTDARTVKITSAATGVANGAGVPVTVTVTDRFGNAVSGVALNIVASGVGSFKGGNTTQSFTTDSTGTYTFLADTNVSDGGVAKFTATSGTASTSMGDSAGYVGATEADATLAAGNSTASASITFSAGASSSDIAQSAVDAAAEATDAANAATDAANAAAEAADAATAAAQDAADAVAALSAQVATLISGLKAQLTALTNLIIKIQKKVKA